MTFIQLDVDNTRVKVYTIKSPLRCNVNNTRRANQFELQLVKFESIGLTLRYISCACMYIIACSYKLGLILGVWKSWIDRILLFRECLLSLAEKEDKMDSGYVDTSWSLAGMHQVSCHGPLTRKNCGLGMRRECWERFSPPMTSKGTAS